MNWSKFGQLEMVNPAMDVTAGMVMLVTPVMDWKMKVARDSPFKPAGGPREQASKQSGVEMTHQRRELSLEGG